MAIHIATVSSNRCTSTRPATRYLHSKGFSLEVADERQRNPAWRCAVKHQLCYCSSLPGSKCDFCSGRRKGTLDDYKSLLKWYQDSPLVTGAPKLLAICEEIAAS